MKVMYVKTSEQFFHFFVKHTSLKHIAYLGGGVSSIITIQIIFLKCSSSAVGLNFRRTSYEKKNLYVSQAAEETGRKFALSNQIVIKFYVTA